MSRKVKNYYGDNFEIEEKEELNYDKVEKIKRENVWSADSDDDMDIFDEAFKESHGYREATTLLGNLIYKITSNDDIKANDDAWTIVFEAYQTLVSRDTLGAFEKGELESWWLRQLDKRIPDPEIPDLIINPLELYTEYAEEEKEKKLTLKIK